MRLHRKSRAHGIIMDMTPMIDVTFQLIIFFMTVSQASVVENETLELPNLAGAEDQKPTELVVNVTQDGKVIVIGQELSVAELDSRVAQIVAERGSPELLSVKLRVDRRATCATANKVLTDLKKRGVVRVQLAVQAPS